jgi:tetratricopeptide (TPR) repeat protein
MVLAFCDIHDTATRDWKGGIERLQRVIALTGDEPELHRALRMALAGTVGALEAMGQLPAGVNVDVEAICLEYLEADPPVLETWEALMLLSERATKFEGGAGRPELRRKVEAFIDAHLDRPETAAASKLLGEYYVSRREYPTAVAWLRKSIRHELVNPMMDAGRILTLARILHRELHDRDGARETYDRFLKRFPLSRNAAMVQRQLRTLEAGR